MCRTWLTCLLGLLLLIVKENCAQQDGLNGNGEKGLFPIVFNLAANAKIEVNSTCGELEPETYCKLVEHVVDAPKDRQPQCSICDLNSADETLRHLPEYAIDGSHRWWQSPSLANGRNFNFVTITLDLGQVFQVAYIIIKAAISPRPGNWILERSVDGIDYKPWQYYAMTDSDCWNTYGLQPTVGLPRYRSDDEVICTSRYSHLEPLEKGEIHTSLVNGRPGVKGPSNKLIEFTSARYVRLRLQRIRTLLGDLMSVYGQNEVDGIVSRRYFYSIKDISIGGQCICFGHADECPFDRYEQQQKCDCQHNTCGESCEKCCPLFNQQPWRPGTTLEGAICEECQCYDHAEECVYNETVALQSLSQDKSGNMKGGGVCIDCAHNTAGINCEKCQDGYYRPASTPQNHPDVCQPCECYGYGTTGQCVADEDGAHEGASPGDCICKDGFDGPKCDRCAYGYRGYPICEACPCDPDGSLNYDVCEGDCECKPNTYGTGCEYCQPGYFNLDRDNPDGCEPCFCFGVTEECQSVDWGADKITRLSGWSVTDLEGSQVVNPATKNHHLVISSYDTYALNREAFYWMAPLDYLGDKIAVYGGTFEFVFMYDKPRDKREDYLSGPDVVFESGDVRIGYGGRFYRDNYNETLEIPMEEGEWRFLDEQGSTGRIVAKKDFMSVLHKLERLLLRASFHTEQTSSVLLSVSMDIANMNSSNQIKMKSVEECICPIGYLGLSCEDCAPGWRRVNDTLYDGICEQCHCFGHAEYCDNADGACYGCLHHTRGKNCEECEIGYYGDATQGTEFDCRQCACPLTEPSNNFSPTCIAHPMDPDHYICDDCPMGYAGNHCEMCADAYFGDPQIPGNYCRPCQCNGNVDPHAIGNCDRRSGECLKCIADTEGWMCDRCKDGYFGTAINHDCSPCECNVYGSIRTECDRRTGQCKCKKNIDGRRCDRCAALYGNLRVGCEPCNCSSVGSVYQQCDFESGQCQCKPGVFGRYCTACNEGYYGFGDEGCYFCDCDASGATSQKCNQNSGQCDCRPNVVGRRCNTCLENHWNITSKDGCVPCNCNTIGSTNTTCDVHSGQCYCKQGVYGLQCDKCQYGFYGFGPDGCKRCPRCEKPGQICDPVTGECVCPPNTEGDRCEKCVDGTWGYHYLEGCKPCDCDDRGSFGTDCNVIEGQCLCRQGYTGRKCDQCTFGHFDFPICKKCRCSIAGTSPDQCNDDDDCACNEKGACLCKENVMGKKCKKCRSNSFSLAESNPSGCTSCFCFEKSEKCKQAEMIWSNITSPERIVQFKEDGRDPLVTTAGYSTVPVGTKSSSYQMPRGPFPVYWSLPQSFIGDKVLSYNGELSFVLSNKPHIRRFDLETFANHPLVQITGNSRIVLQYYPTMEELEYLREGAFSIPLREDKWKGKTDPDIPLTRKTLMVALQKVESVLIRATFVDNIELARYRRTGFQISLQRLSLDVAVPMNESSGNIALGVEQCQCPPEYTGSSCQDPAPGFYRDKKDDYLDSNDTIDLVGVARPCMCSNHGDMCEKETGACFDCKHNTAGDRCDECAPGYYGNATVGTPYDCQPCECPLPNNNPLCHVELSPGGGAEIICDACEEGYRGEKCELCMDGYYGNPLRVGDTCKPCNCNPQGSVSEMCDSFTGQCECFPSITGRACDECEPRHAVTEGGRCKSCDEGCTKDLMKSVDELEDIIANLNISGLSPAPWKPLLMISNRTDALREEVDQWNEAMDQAKSIADSGRLFSIESSFEVLLVQAGGDAEEAEVVAEDAAKAKHDAKVAEEDIKLLEAEIIDTVQNIHSLVQNKTSSLNATSALEEAEAILKEIKDRNFGLSKYRADNELSAAKETAEKVFNMTLNPLEVDKVTEHLDGVRIKLEELVDITNNEVRKPLDETVAIVTENSKKLKKLKQNTKKTRDLVKEVTKMLVEAEDLLADANDNMYNATHHYEPLLAPMVKALRNLKDNLTYISYDAMAKGGILAQLLPKYSKDYLEPAERHAEELMRQAQALEDQFAGAREHAADPLKAAEVYKNIVKAIDEANQAATEAKLAAEKAYDKAAQSGLNERAKKLKLKSGKILDEAKALNATGLQNLLEYKIEKLEEVDEVIQDVRSALYDLEYEAKSLPSDLTSKLEDAITKATEAEELAQDVMNRAEEMQDQIDNDLLPKLRAIQGLSTEAFDNASLAVQQATSDIYESRELAFELETRAETMQTLNSQITYNLKQLRDKITLARHRASSIKVSMSAPDGDCVRRLRPNVQPGSTNRIVLHYSTSKPTEDSLLFYLGSSAFEDFLGIEMVDRHIRFVWNVGGGSQEITHPLEIMANDDVQSDPDLWYRIEAVRIATEGSLSVQLVTNLLDEDPDKVTGQSAKGFTKIELDPSSYFYIGGLPLGFKVSPSMKTRSFTGCMGDVMVDGSHVGLWNFLSSAGNCAGCTEVPAAKRAEKNIYKFNGQDSYSVSPQIRGYNSRRYAASMQFKTLAENGLLFFSANKQSQDFMSVELVDGKVVFQYYLGGSSRVRMETKQKYNNGLWVSVVARRYGLDGLLEVSDGVQEKEEYQDSAPAGGPSGLELLRSDIYIGGVPPDFLRDNWKTVSMKSFRGCIKMPHAGSTVLDLTMSRSYGMVPGCEQEVVHTLGFSGKGYYEMDALSLDQSASLQVTVASDQEEGLILLSREISPTADAEHVYSLSLFNGRIVARVNIDDDSLQLSSTEQYNDATPHTITLVKEGARSVELRVDDITVDSGLLARSTSSVRRPSIASLYVGGVPEKFDVKDMAVTSVPYLGCISDFIYNKELVILDQPKNFTNVEIGRCSLPRRLPPTIPPPPPIVFATRPVPTVPPQGKAVPSTTASTVGEQTTFPQTTKFLSTEMPISCAPPVDYAREEMGVKYGDVPNSYSQIAVKRKDIQTNFNIRFDFRTYIADGLLFYFANAASTNYIAVQVADERVVLSYNFNRNKQELKTGPAGLNDGKWHKVQVTKTGVRIKLSVDQSGEAEGKAKKRISVRPPMYVGGLPPDVIDGEGVLTRASLRGCIRNFRINAERIDLAGTGAKTFGVRHCYKTVEPGAYFAGDAYAIYDDRFETGSRVSIELQFRTRQYNGMLLSTAEPAGQPALSLQLFEGSLYITADMGEGYGVFNASVSPHTEFSLCDGEWHKVVAAFVNNLVTLKVDDLKSEAGYTPRGSLRELKSNSPLYIGGLPDDAHPQGTLLTSENFVGCMRHLSIKDTRRDWTEMHRMHNVQLNCPDE